MTTTETTPQFPYSYKKVHHLLRDTRGPAKDHTCSCGEPATEWAYQFTGGEAEIRNPDGSRPHSPNPDDYLPMCNSCHRRLEFEKDPRMSRNMNPGPGIKALREKWADPEWSEKMQGVLRKNSLAIAERRKQDPEFDQKFRGRRNFRRQRCLTCGIESTPAGMASHMRFKGHLEWAYVNPDPEDETDD